MVNCYIYWIYSQYTVFTFHISIAMKHLKFLFLPLVIVSLLSSVKADNCPDIWGWFFSCESSQYCATTSCECNGNIIYSWDTCGQSCTDVWGWFFSCNAGDYCTASTCDCDGVLISSWDLCTPTPPPPGSCTLDGKTLFNWQMWIFFQAPSVAYPWTCSWLPRTCSIVGWIGTLSAAPWYVSWYVYSWCIAWTPPTGSCSTPRWTTVSSGTIATWYTTSSVSCWSTCTSEIRTCSNGNWYNVWIQMNFSPTILYGSCSINSCGGWGGGGWGGGGSSTSTTGTTTSGSTTGTGNLPIGSIVGSTRSTELNNAYLRGYAHSITTMNTIKKADMWGVLYRAHMAKMISNFAISLGGLVPNTGKNCTFNDISNQSSELRFYIKLACQLGLMGLNTNGTPDHEFNPEAIVTRSQFGTILSRVIRWSQYNGGDPFYAPHLLALKNASIMTQISNPTSINEIRGYVMIMMKRAYEGGFLNN